MSKHRRAARTDLNQSAIVKSRRQIPGVSVEVGHDDILVGRHGITYWFEIKRPECIGKDGKVRPSELTPSEAKLLEDWLGHYSVVSTLEEILKEINA